MGKTRIIGLGAIVSILLTLDAGASSPRSPPEWSGKKKASKTANLEFRITMRKKTYALGETIGFEYELRNVGSDDLWINTRLLAGPDGTPDGPREVMIDVRDVKGDAQRYTCFDKRMLAPATSYRVVRSGEVIRRGDILRCYHLRPGNYAIRALYRDVNPMGPEPPLGAKHLTDEIEAPLVWFRVIEAPRGASAPD
jgi:hypothetical protein